MSEFLPGQRWLSQAEPELGLGTVLRVEGRSVQVYFGATGQMRQYARQSAPLSRALFRLGDRISVAGGRRAQIEGVDEADGLRLYRIDGQWLPETQLDDLQALSQADERLKSGRVDTNARYELRLEALERRAAARRARSFGFASARVDLIPHQLRVAWIAASRRRPRVLLADEVGLGKTIEAGLILQRLHLCGRAERILVVLPESLVHQWFVELLRRFNLAFAIFDESRCEAIELAGDGRNPFEDEQRIIVDLRFLREAPRRVEQLLAARWDLVVVDEAHHLEWSPGQPSAEYRIIEALGRHSPGLVLLTATPEQLGRTGHFARLRLLDPERFGDLEHYLRDAERYLALSRCVDRLGDPAPLSSEERAELASLLAPEPCPEHCQTLEARTALIAQLVDRHGTGRVMFRHRRASIGGFPERLPQLQRLSADRLAEGDADRLLLEFQADIGALPAAAELDYRNDPRLDWLLGLLETWPEAKLLLICRSPAKVLALEEALRQRSGIGVARFHEGLSLAQRDRNAAWFADPDGARLLLCSEIGSEGRNFQFAQHLVLWDLPLDPDLLEQRIGRLDRIGQRGRIHIHHAAVEGSGQALLQRWYDEALDAFRRAPADGRELLRRFGPRLAALAPACVHGDAAAEQAFDALLVETREHHQELQALVQAGRDHLLEVAAEVQCPGNPLLEALVEDDLDLDRDDFVLRLLELFGVQNEQIGPRSYLLDPEYATTEGLPGLDQGPVPVSFDRSQALAREDLPLLRLEHPLPAAALDLLLGSETGNATLLMDPQMPPRRVVLECVHVLECIAPASLDVARFLPPLPVRVAVDQRLEPIEDFSPSEEARMEAGDRPLDGSRYRNLLAKLLPPMLKAASDYAERQAAELREQATRQAQAALDEELERLEGLARINPALDPAEIAAVLAEREALRERIPQARLRLDAVRFCFGRDFQALARS